MVSARPLVFVLTLTLLQKTVKSIFWHPSETQAFAVHDHAFAQLSVFHCSARGVCGAAEEKLWDASGH